MIVASAAEQNVQGGHDDGNRSSDREHLPQIANDAEGIEEQDDTDGHAIEGQKLARAEEHTDAERYDDEDGPPFAEERKSVDQMGGDEQPDHTCHEQQGAKGNGPEGFHIVVLLFCCCVLVLFCSYVYYFVLSFYRFIVMFIMLFCCCDRVGFCAEKSAAKIRTFF